MYAYLNILVYTCSDQDAILAKQYWQIPWQWQLEPIMQLRSAPVVLPSLHPCLKHSHLEASAFQPFQSIDARTCKDIDNAAPCVNVFVHCTGFPYQIVAIAVDACLYVLQGNLISSTITALLRSPNNQGDCWWCHSRTLGVTSCRCKPGRSNCCRHFVRIF